jgi:hypothetical protein
MLSRPVKFALLAIAFLLATALGFGAYMLSQLAPIGNAYAAKTLCSGVFVSGRDAAAVIQEDIVADNHPLLGLIHSWIEAGNGVASASLFGLMRRDARFRPGLGCTIVIGDLAPLAASPTAVSQSSEEELPSGAPAMDVDRGKLHAALDWAYAEPDPLKLRRTRAVIVVHRGRIIAERYAAGIAPQTPLLGWSMTKSVTAILVGLLVKQGKLSLDQTALVPQCAGPAHAHDQRPALHRGSRRSVGRCGADVVRARG